MLRIVWARDVCMRDVYVMCVVVPHTYNIPLPLHDLQHHHLLRLLLAVPCVRLETPTTRDDGRVIDLVRANARWRTE